MLTARQEHIEANISCVCFVRDRIWLSKANGVISIRDIATGREFAHFLPVDFATTPNVMTMYYDEERDRVWMGTRDGCLSAYDAQTANLLHSTSTYPDLKKRQMIP
eukprot:101333-Amorphochlora_amoeboformis.AAC.1